MPPGVYRLRLWHPGLGPGVEPPPVMLTVGAADLDRALRLPVREAP